ncbi:TPA: hypothetical protein N0F65_001510 [Lagenidium giganteum]|uniref:Cilia- and flagella-associated protein 36 n=1 Tax=Lagenidium giganteum TaxID=4803 RepID=A0AAV2Z3J1_9STRA|nr:TPA: hypothetical protein N0F65_001510 [Lagenidium giganteum]
MSDVDLTQDESEWVFDYAMHLFQSPAWEVPIMCFIDENCAMFDTGEENKFIYTELHDQFRELVESVLCSNLAEIGITASDFADICERSRHSTDISIEVVNQILAMDDFLTFKKLMVKRNLELELEAIKSIQEETLESGNVDDQDLQAHLMELSIMYKQEEMEQAELESAIAMSIAVQEEQLRLASVASKVAEDKFDESPERKNSLSPEEVQRHVRDSKKKAEEIFKKNKDSLEENRSKQKEWQGQAEIPDDEIKRREEYLRKQRDRIVEKKKKERESQLKEYRQELKETPPELPTQLVEKTKNSVQEQEELKKSEIEERRNALRIDLARRMKQDLLESASSSNDERNTGIKVQQLVELDEKMQRVEELRRRSQEHERKVQTKLVKA